MSTLGFCCMSLGLGYGVLGGRYVNGIAPCSTVSYLTGHKTDWNLNLRHIHLVVPAPGPILGLGVRHSDIDPTAAAHPRNGMSQNCEIFWPISGLLIGNGNLAWEKNRSTMAQSEFGAYEFDECQYLFHSGDGLLSVATVVSNQN